MAPYERFGAWKACHDLALAVYRATRGFPREELYGLSSQARRAACSAAANIAEGSAKFGRREFTRFLDIANGSLSEVGYLLRLCRDLGLLSAEEAENLETLHTQAGRRTWRLYDAVTRGRYRSIQPLNRLPA